MSVGWTRTSREREEEEKRSEQDEWDEGRGSVEEGEIKGCG
jgi:hypothetical protein